MEAAVAAAQRRLGWVSIADQSLVRVGQVRGLRGEGRRGGVRSGSGMAARTILLFHIIGAIQL